MTTIDDVSTIMQALDMADMKLMPVYHRTSVAEPALVRLVGFIALTKELAAKYGPLKSAELAMHDECGWPWPTKTLFLQGHE